MRQAPAVAVDPAPALPEPRSSAPSDRGLVVLEAPAGEQADQALIKHFFEAVIARDADRLEALFENGAKTKTSAQASGTDALDFWKSRLSRLDYSQLSGHSVYRLHSIEVYREQDLELLSAERRLPVTLDEHQVAVRVPLHAAESSKTRLFGNEIVFLLTPGKHGLRISEMVEDFQLP